MPQPRPDFSGDTQRPIYHYLPPKNWMNDPNGNFYWDGLYHLFYQSRDVPHNEGKEGWGIWRHTATADFIHWTDYPVAFIGDKDGPDYVGCWSGGHILHEDTHYLVYWGNRGGMCIGASQDNFHTWQKHPRNPVISAPGEDDEWFLHDPTLWHDGDWVYMVSGWQIGERRGIGTSKDAGYVFRSKNMLDWDYRGLFYEPGEESDLAVPDFFPLGDRYMLLFASHTRGAQYYLGTYADGRFEPQQRGRINYSICHPDPGLHVSGDLIAPRTWEAPDGRRIMIAWITEGRTSEAMASAGWAGVMSVPRELWLHQDGTVRTAPVRELEALRGKGGSLGGLVARDQEIILEGIQGDSLELLARIDCGTAQQVGLKLRCSPDGAEQTVVRFDRTAGEIALDVADASRDQSLLGVLPQRASFNLSDSEPLLLRAFLDHSVVEVFVGDRLCLTKRIYPSDAESLGLHFFALDGEAILEQMEYWPMGTCTYSSVEE